MFIVDITLTEPADAPGATERLEAHRAWFARHVEEGDFLIVGPRRDRERAGVVVAQVASRQRLDEILAEDAYFPDGATYEVSELTAGLVAQGLERFREA